MSSNASPAAGRVLVEGPPRVGKTTVVRRTVNVLRALGMQLTGFTTVELRRADHRIGFAVEDLDGSRAVIARVSDDGPAHVGRYAVDVAAFEAIALPALNACSHATAVVIDEVGKMQLASAAFRSAVGEVFAADTAVLATVQSAAHPFTDALKQRPDIEHIMVTHSNRDTLADQLAGRLLVSR